MAHNVGAPVEDAPRDLRPEDWDDPEPKITGYFVIWGFALLLASVVALEFVAYASTLGEEARKGTPSAGADPKGDAHRRTGLDPSAFKAEQLQRLQAPQAGGMPLDAAMQKVIQEKS